MTNGISPPAMNHARAGMTSAIQRASARSGVNFDYLVDLARVESGFDPNAQAPTSSARGLYQFTKSTWLATLQRHGAANGYGWAAEAIDQDSNGQLRIADPAMRAAVLNLRDDPAAAADMAAHFTSDNRDILAGRIGREPEPVDLYLAHFLGVNGAAQFLMQWSKDPDQMAAPLMPSAAAANRSVFYAPDGAMRSLDQVRSRFQARLGNDPGNQPYPSGSTSMMAASHSMGASRATRNVLQMTERAPLTLDPVRPMPRRLSLEFAADAYRRLASLGGGSVRS